jgi:deoxyribodipyrimidine photo-lyase
LAPCPSASWRAGGKTGGQGCEGAQTWLSELAWRDFYFMILWHHPQVVTQSFKPEYDRVQDEAPALWQAWCEARTGYPLVDAAMRQLLQTGYMHNRLRMVVASFLTKDLGIDWRRGELFAQHLNDYDLAANNGGWQWAASTGCDAQPYFRIFNPITQSQRSTLTGFIRRYLPELARVPDAHIFRSHETRRSGRLRLRLGVDYPLPVVDHARARQRTLMRFSILSESEISRRRKCGNYVTFVTFWRLLRSSTSPVLQNGCISISRPCPAPSRSWKRTSVVFDS